ncbi:hypothetical protein TESG_04493 [Trichophyton tonsurans CBS 112818]|uniref:Pentatricopeptide repeat protein n=1 Tax=Trichophyton tonsurans (strain CBS 112818) TaxID=647933 RepID=F2S0H4_TRIT1|nr:hypothetical protein TESG_04493 [Trichophyton tonsurans CBS 112818]
MFSGSRYCLSRKASIPVAENISAALKNEPLLFLYPPAFAAAIDNSIGLTKTRTASDNRKPGKERINRVPEDVQNRQSRSSQRSGPEVPGRQKTQPKSQCQEISGSDTIIPTNNTENTPLDTVPAPPIVEYDRDDKASKSKSSASYSQPNRSKHALPELLSELDSLATKQGSQPSSQEYNSLGDTRLREAPVRNKGHLGGWIRKSAQGVPLRYTKSMADFDRQNAARNPYAAPPQTPLRYVRHGYNNPISHRVYQPKSLEEQRSDAQRQASICLQLVEGFKGLVNNKPDRPADEFQKTITLSEADVVALVGDERENMWVIPFLSGCRAHVLPQTDDSLGLRHLVLSGTQAAVQAGEKHIEELIQNLPKNDLPPFIPFLRNSSQRPLIRSVWASLPPEPLVPGKNEIKAPKKFTIKTFADYIEDLVLVPVTRLVHGRLHSALGVSHKDAIGDMIRRLMLDPENRQYFSSRSICLAISYFASHHARSSLHSLLPAFEGRMTSRTVNALLRASVLRRDFVSLKWCINAMKRQGIYPRNWAWVSVLSSITPHAHRFDLLVQARKSGVFDDAHVFQVAASISIQPRFGKWLKDGGTVSGFMKHMDETLGHGWLSVRTINRMILEGSLSSKPNVISDILEYCERVSFGLDTTSLNNALFYFLHQSDKMSKAFVALYLKVTQTFNIKGDDQTMDILWHLAWRARAYNLCRVLWRHGCLNGWTTQKMQVSIYSSLRREVHGSSLPERECWLQKIGKVVAGVIPFENLEADTSQDFNKLVLGVCGSPSDVYPEWRKELAKKLVDSDLSASDDGYEYREPLNHVLERAYALDEEWGACHDKPVDWLRKNSVTVDIVKVDVRPPNPRGLKSSVKREPLALAG